MFNSNIREFPRPSAAMRAGRSCTVRTDAAEVGAFLRDISAAGVFIETDHHLSIDDDVVVSHPVAGSIRARVTRVGKDGAALAFPSGDDAATFALASLCAGMTIGTEARPSNA